MDSPEPTCKGCGASVRLSEGEVRRILAAYLDQHPQPLADDTVAAARLASCRSCTDLQYGTTCRHCGCLVEVIARLANRSCPSPRPHW